jgi:cytochrome c biogenesis factor
MYYYNDASGEQKAMVWPHIQRFLTHDVYMAVSEPIIFAWKEPVWFKPGEKKTISGATVEYRKMTMQGEPGQPDAVFGADLVVGIQDANANVTEYESEPQFSVSEGPKLAAVNDSFMMAMTRMDVKDKSVELQLMFSPALYQIEMFHKPLVILVWLGAGIMLFGGLLTAYARRRPRKPSGSGSMDNREPEEAQPEPAATERELAGTLHMKPIEG